MAVAISPAERCPNAHFFLVGLQSGLSLRRHASKLIDERLPKSWLARAYVSYVTRAGCLATMTCFALRRLIYDYFIFVYSIMLCL